MRAVSTSNRDIFSPIVCRRMIRKQKKPTNVTASVTGIGGGSLEESFKVPGEGS
jgi:hypothetical protein